MQLTEITPITAAIMIGEIVRWDVAAAVEPELFVWANYRGMQMGLSKWKFINMVLPELQRYGYEETTVTDPDKWLVDAGQWLLDKYAVWREQQTEREE